MFNSKKKLITGTTKLFSSRYIEYLITNSKPKKIICYSKDVLNQYYLNNKINLKGFKKLLIEL